MFHKAYSKVNLALKIFPKEQGINKHKIDSVMLIHTKIYDKIKINKSNELTIKYIDQYQQEMKIENCSITKILNWIKTNFPSANINYKITVIKNIPIGSGLGGESTDAGYVLRKILNKNKLPQLTQDQLKDIALNVGSDIPFFYSKSMIAHVSNYGDIVTPIIMPYIYIDVYKTNVNCSTKKIFELLDQDKEYKSIVETRKLYEDYKMEVFDNKAVYNDLEKYVFQQYPKVLDDYRKLNKIQKNNIIVNGAGSSLIIIKF